MGAFAETVSQPLPVLPKVGTGKQSEHDKPAAKPNGQFVDAAGETRNSALAGSHADADLRQQGGGAQNGVQAGFQTGAGAEISAEAAESFIEDKRIGERIKYLRQRKHMGLVELGKHTGLSASFLSQLETGRVIPTLRNLARIAMVFSKDMSYFFEPERFELFRILRSEERQKLPQTGAEEPGYFFESLGQVPSDQPIAPYVAEFLPSSEKRVAKAHQHTGNEFLYVLEGCLKLEHDGKVEALEGGDAVFFNAEAVHSYESKGDTSCTALILTMPEPLRGTHSGAKVPLSPAAGVKTSKAAPSKA